MWRLAAREYSTVVWTAAKVIWTAQKSGEELLADSAVIRVEKMASSS